MWNPQDGFYTYDSDFLNFLGSVNATSVISGMTVVQTGGGAQSVTVAAGVYLIGGTRVIYAGGVIAAPAADANNPRKDILVADNAGALSFVQGTAAQAIPTGETGVRTYQPVPPNIPASVILLVEVWREANDNTIATNDIVEKFILTPGRMIGRELLTAQGQIIYASAAQTPTALAPGVDGQYLKTQGAAADPIWASAQMAYTEITVPPGQVGTGAWVDFDVSGVCPAGAKAVVIQLGNVGGVQHTVCGCRKNGSASTYTIGDTGYFSMCWVVELDANRIIEIIDSAGGTFYAIGYFN